MIESQSDIAPAVLDMVGTAINPLVAVTLLPQVQIPGANMGFHRSMGFISERFRGNLRLVTTCRHALLGYETGYDIAVTMKNLDPARLRVVGKPIFDTNPESDVAFLI